MSQSNRLKNILTGYMRAMPDIKLDEIYQIDWSELAKREQEKRSSRLIEALDDELLNSIAKGDLCISKVAREIRSEQ